MQGILGEGVLRVLGEIVPHVLAAGVLSVLGDVVLRRLVLGVLSVLCDEALRTLDAGVLQTLGDVAVRVFANTVVLALVLSRVHHVLRLAVGAECGIAGVGDC
eukprot:10966549-Alexandrium_andersonii.AAC.1